MCCFGVVGGVCLFSFECWLFCVWGVGVWLVVVGWVVSFDLGGRPSGPP